MQIFFDKLHSFLNGKIKTFDDVETREIFRHVSRDFKLSRTLFFRSRDNRERENETLNFPFRTFPAICCKRLKYRSTSSLYSCFKRKTKKFI